MPKAPDASEHKPKSKENRDSESQGEKREFQNNHVLF